MLVHIVKVKLLQLNSARLSAILQMFNFHLSNELDSAYFRLQESAELQYLYGLLACLSSIMCEYFTWRSE